MKLEPVDYDPFNGKLEPVDYDPFQDRKPVPTLGEIIRPEITRPEFWSGINRGVVETVGGPIQAGAELIDKVAGTELARKYTEKLNQFKSTETPEEAPGKLLGAVGTGVALTAGLPMSKGVGLVPSLKRVAQSVGYAGAYGFLSPTEKPYDLEQRLEQAESYAPYGLFQLIPEAIALGPKIIQKAAQSKTGQAGTEIEKETGTKLTLGQKSGHEGISELERGALSGEKGAQIVSDQLDDAVRYMEDIANQARKKLAGASWKQPSGDVTRDAGIRALESAKQAESRLIYQRQEASRKAYGLFKRAVGDKPVIEPTNLLKKLTEMADVAAPATPEARAASRTTLKTLSAQMESGGGKITAEQFLNWQRKISKELFEKLDKYGKAKVQRDLMEALDQDIASYSGEAAVLLQKAKSTYEKGSKLIDDLRESAVGKFLGEKDPYKAADSYLKMTPEEMRQLNKYLGPSEALDDLQANAIFSILEKSSKHPERLAGKSQFNPNEFIDKFPSRKHVDAMFTDPKRKEQVIYGLKLMDRIADKFGSGGQGLGVRQTFADVLGNMAGGNPIFIARLTGKVLGPVGLRWMIFSPNGQKTLRALASLPPSSPAFQTALIELSDNLEE